MNNSADKSATMKEDARDSEHRVFGWVSCNFLNLSQDSQHSQTPFWDDTRSYLTLPLQTHGSFILNLWNYEQSKLSFPYVVLMSMCFLRVFVCSYLARQHSSSVEYVWFFSFASLDAACRAHWILAISDHTREGSSADSTLLYSYKHIGLGGWGSPVSSPSQ